MHFLMGGRGKALLMLHGWGASASLMEHPAKGLMDIRTIYIPDLPGFGKSAEPPTAWSVGNYTKLIQEFIVSHFSDQPYDVLVHSYGARILLKWLGEMDAEDIPKPEKILITGGAGLKPKRKPDFYARKYTAKLLKAPILLLPEPLKSKANHQLRQTALWKKLGSSDYNQLSGVMRQTFVNSVGEFLDYCLPKVKQEVFLLWGENDSSTPMDQAKRMEKALPNATLVTIKDAGHYAFLDQPAQFKAIARAYFEG